MSAEKGKAVLIAVTGGPSSGKNSVSKTIADALTQTGSEVKERVNVDVNTWVMWCNRAWPVIGTEVQGILVLLLPVRRSTSSPQIVTNHASISLRIVTRSQNPSSIVNVQMIGHGDRICTVLQEYFYKDLTEQQLAHPAGVNFDHPSKFVTNNQEGRLEGSCVSCEQDHPESRLGMLSSMFSLKCARGVRGKTLQP